MQLLYTVPVSVVAPDHVTGLASQMAMSLACELAPYNSSCTGVPPAKLTTDGVACCKAAKGHKRGGGGGREHRGLAGVRQSGLACRIAT